jgi:hypothetical protein
LDAVLRPELAELLSDLTPAADGTIGGIIDVMLDRSLVVEGGTLHLTLQLRRSP